MMRMQKRFNKWEPPVIEDGVPTKYNWVVQNSKGLRLGYETDIGAFSYKNAQYEVLIDGYVQIGSHCSVYTVSTIDGKKGKVTLKKKCCIGSHSTIMPGITVGENSIVGAHSFVNKDIPDNVVAFGVPAKIIKKLET